MHKLLEGWQEWFEHNKGRAGSTITVYLNALNRLDVYLFNHGDKDFIKASKADLEAFSGSYAHKQGLSPAARKPLIAALKSFYGWLEEQGYIKHSPAAKLVYPKAGKPLPVAIGLQNAQKLLEDCDLQTFIGCRDAAIIALLMATGMRVTGVSDLNFESFFMGVDDKGAPLQLVRAREKGKKERIIPLQEEAKMYLTVYMEHEEMKQLKPQLLQSDGNYCLFTQTNRGRCAEHDWHGAERRLKARGIQRMLKSRGRRLEIPEKELHPHAFRHLFGTELVESDIDLKRVQMLLGHESLEYTGIYIHLAHRKLMEAVVDGSPLSKIRTPMHDLKDELDRAKRKKAS